MKASTRNLDTPNILIVNVHSTKNAGDAALLLMNIRQLRAGFKTPRFLISANYPDEALLRQIPDAGVVPSAFALIGTNSDISVPLQILRLLAGGLLAILSGLFPFRPASRQSGVGWVALIEAFRQADLVVAVSGNQFLSMGRYGWPFPVTAFPVWLSHLYHKPFYVMPQSIGPLKRGWEKQLLKLLYSRARMVFLRDDISLSLAQQIGLPPAHVFFAPDPAFALEATDPNQALKILARYGYHKGQPAVGITVIAQLARTLDQRRIEQTYHDLASVLDRFSRSYGVRIYIFNQVTGPTAREDDRNAGRELLSHLPEESGQIVMVDEVLSPMQLKACYARMNLMIASRLHSGIFAMGAGVATLLLGYFTKSRGLMRSMGMEEWMLDIGQADAGEMWEKLSLAWLNRQAVAEAARSKAEEFAGSVLQLGAQVREDYCHA